MFGIALPVFALPADLQETPDVHRRIHPARTEGAEREVRFLWREARPPLPFRYHSELLLVSWGNRDSGSRLPVSVGARIEETGKEPWRELDLR